MATPVHILLALTKEGLERYRASDTKDGPSTRFRLGLSKALVDLLKEGLRKYGFETLEVGTVVLGRPGLNADRDQYQSKALLKMARDRAKSLSDWHTKVLLITDADIYDVDTLFVAGQAEVNGRGAVVSFARL